MPDSITDQKFWMGTLVYKISGAAKKNDIISQ